MDCDVIRTHDLQKRFVYIPEIQAALVIRGLFICGFAYSRSQNCLFHRTNPSNSALNWSFYLRIRNSRSNISRTYLPQITRETCTHLQYDGDPIELCDCNSRFETTLTRPRQRSIPDRVGQVDQAGLQRGGEVEHREGHEGNSKHRL